MVYNTDNLYYFLETQQKVSNNLHRHQTNEYEYMFSDCNKISYSEHVCRKLLNPKLKIKIKFLNNYLKYSYIIIYNEL